jgi:type IV pilus assembly protein PilA
VFQRYRQDEDAGFTLVELMVVVLVIAILIAIAIPTFLGARERAQDRAAQVSLHTAIKAQASYNASDTTTGFSAVEAVMEAEESSLDWSGAADDSIHVVVGDVIAGDAQQVLVYTKSNTGTWFGLKLVTQSNGAITAGQFTCLGATAASVDGLADCLGNDW